MIHSPPPFPDPEPTRKAIDAQQEPCTPVRRCRKWQTCPECGKARQRAFADVAERLVAMAPAVFHTVIRPSHQTAAHMRAALEEWRKALPLASALYHVHSDPDARGWHCHVIHSSRPPHALKYARVEHSTPVGDARAAGAYIARPSAAPLPGEWPGRAAGRWGPLWRYLTDSAQPVVVQAAAMEKALALAAESPTEQGAVLRDNLDRHRRWHEQQHAAARNLSRIFAILGMATGQQNDRMTATRHTAQPDTQARNATDETPGN